MLTFGVELIKSTIVGFALSGNSQEKLMGAKTVKSQRI